MVAGERPTVADFQEVLGDHGIELRRNGAEWAGPCPLCGGKDRFHVADSGGYALIGCRGCIDGEPEDNRKQRYGEIMALLFPRASPSPKAAMGRKAHKPSSNRTSRTAKTNPTTTAQAAELWAATVKCEDTPAQTYLVGRRAWPEREPAPLTVGWLAKEQAPAFVGHSLPRMAAGAIVFAQTDACATLQAVQVEALSQDGRRLDRTDRPDPWRQNYGSKAGAFFQADRMAPCGLVLCEGPVDALATLWLYPGWSAWATCGTAGLKSIDGGHFARAGWPVEDPITIVSDPGYPGQEAAMAAEDALSAAGLAVALDMRRDGQGDLADELKASIQGKVDEGESLTRAWELFLGERTHKSPGSG